MQHTIFENNSLDFKNHENHKYIKYNCGKTPKSIYCKYATSQTVNKDILNIYENTSI